MLAAFLCAAPAMAEVRVNFDEGAPKDRFTILNAGDCALGAAAVTIDLEGSAGGLIFDVTGSGAGVQVFQPFEAADGADLLTARPVVSDGDRAVTLALRGLAAGARVAFTIDVDDTTSGYGIMVSGAEIAGGSVRVETDGTRAEGRFGEDAVARVTVAGCLS